MPRSHHRDEHAVEFGRIVAFSDGVFAIAATLLVLSIGVPELAAGHHDRLGHALADLWPELLSYFISFAVIGNLWIVHHGLFGQLERFDDRLIRLNLLFLCFISLLPLPTSVMGEYGEQGIAVVVYAFTIAVIGLIKAAMLAYAHRAGLLVPAVRPHVAGLLARGLVVPIVFLASAPIALVGADAAKYCWLAIIPLARVIDARTAGVDSVG